MIAIKTFHKRQNIANCLHFSQLTSDTPGVFVTREGDGVDWLPRALWGQRGAGECLFKDEHKRILISSWYSGPSPGTAQVPESDKDKERQGDHQAASPWAGQWLQVGLEIQLDIEKGVWGGSSTRRNCLDWGSYTSILMKNSKTSLDALTIY